MVDDRQEVAEKPGKKPDVQFTAVGLRAKTLDEAYRLSANLARGETVPAVFRNKPSDVFFAMEKAAELGIAPGAALDAFALINGRLVIYGTALLGVVLKQPDLAPGYPKEWWDGEPMTDGWTAHCEVKRGERVVTGTFSYAEARQAGLLEKKGPWQNYPRRMLMWRARGFAARDAFADRFVGVATDTDGPPQMRDVEGETVKRPSKPAVASRIDAGLMEARAAAEDAEFVEVAEQPSEQPAAVEDAEFDLAPPADQDPAYRRLLAAIAKHDREAAMLLIRDGVAGDAVRTLAEGDDEALPELLRHIMDTPPGMGKETIVWIGQAEVPEAAKSEMVELLRRVEGQ